MLFVISFLVERPLKKDGGCIIIINNDGAVAGRYSPSVALQIKGMAVAAAMVALSRAPGETPLRKDVADGEWGYFGDSRLKIGCFFDFCRYLLVCLT